MLNYLTYPLSQLEKQLAYLRNRGMRTLFLHDWYHLRRNHSVNTPDSVCLTFDDGYLDNWVYVFPLAKKYGVRFTIFVSPACIDPSEDARLTLDDYWKGHCDLSDLKARGYLNWRELTLMLESGLVDVQSHGLTHGKNIAAPRVTHFYYGGHQALHTFLNRYPEKRATYWEEERRKPWPKLGTPLFAERSALITKKHRVSASLVRRLTHMAMRFDFGKHAERRAYEKIAWRVVQAYESRQPSAVCTESDAAYTSRLTDELRLSKALLQEKLGKSVDFLCWPFGDCTAQTHSVAKAQGYLATTVGKMESESHQLDRMPRIGGDLTSHRSLLSTKFAFKIGSHYQQAPYAWMDRVYRSIRYPAT